MRDQDQGPVGIARPSRRLAKSRSELQDDSIMGTNNSSITSKRSVECLYFRNEPHFFRHFVKKLQRRSPLINRGYWLRMKAVDHVVRQFLEQESSKRKIVINLGCGYDPLPWQCLTRYPSASKDVTFIDIDYKDLMIKKRNAIQSTSQLNSMLTNIEILEGDILLRSDQYLQLGCDLRDLANLQRSLTSVIDIDSCLILLTAEVSITYMDVESADALIKWAGNFPDGATLPETASDTNTDEAARFCLLEQLLPGGMQHPFAQTMMAHFDNLRTPLRPVQEYPTTSDQENRFRHLGWRSVLARNLWELWSAPDFIEPGERRSLDLVEPFDEWEEFSLFGCHYVLLVADTSVANSRFIELSKQETANLTDESADLSSPTPSILTTYSEYPKGQGCRRFASMLPIRSSDPSKDIFGSFAGLGLTTRVNTIDIYAADLARPYVPDYDAPSATPSSRMCHTTTNLGDTGTLLVGGRTSPNNALADCWLYHKWLGVWERVSDLPQPRYRHQAVHLGHGYVFISTGRRDSCVVADEYYVWNRRTGWSRCDLGDGATPPPVYGANFFLTDFGDLQVLSESRTGILAGGISEDAILLEDVWQWELSDISSSHPILKFRRIAQFRHHALILRFGASTVHHNEKTYIVGGIIKDRLLKPMEEVCVFEAHGNDFSALSLSLNHSLNTPRPLLIGTTAVSAGRCLVILGGSAVCFSFGAFWNKGCYTLHEVDSKESKSHSPTEAPGEQPGAWKYLHTVAQAKAASASASTHHTGQNLLEVPRRRIMSPDGFSQIMQAGKPVILEGLDIGQCTSEWTTRYLKEKVGVGREVIVHDATAEHMNFNTKNFSYVAKRFGDFLEEVEKGQKLYLRSLSSERPSELPANISRDFPSIAADFRLPPELSIVTENAHSSPLRISGPVTMWLHYDVMANILCQVRGTKRLLLFPPSDVKHYGFEPGASSSSVDVFSKLGDYTHTHPHEACLQPGDILFLPALWLHSASPTSGMSIGVNVFFRSLSSGYAAGKDVYGNRDLQAYEKGRQDIARIIKSFDGLPVDVRGFYLQRLVDEFEGKAH